MTLTAFAIGFFIVVAAGQGTRLALARLQQKKRTLEIVHRIFPTATWSWWQRSALADEYQGTIRIRLLDAGRDTTLTLIAPRLDNLSFGILTSHPREDATLEPKRALPIHPPLQPVSWRVIGTRKAWHSNNFLLDEVLEGILTRLLRDNDLRAFWLEHSTNQLIISVRYRQATLARLSSSLHLLRSAYDQLQMASRGELQVLGAGTQAMKCGLCGQAVESNERDLASELSTKTCSTCGLIHHRDCWEYNGRCARCSSS